MHDQYVKGPHFNSSIPRDWDNQHCSRCEMKVPNYRPLDHCTHDDNDDVASTCKNYSPPVTAEIRAANEKALGMVFQDIKIQ